MKFVLLCTTLAIAIPALAATPPTTDPAVDWLLGQATTAPATQPAEAIAPATQPARAGRHGTITLSDGTQITGQITTTTDKPLRLWDEGQKQYQDLPFEMIKSIDAEVVWERDDPEWRFANTGSDVKIYSGKTYPNRLTSYRITLTNGQTYDGAVAAPLTITTEKGPQLYVLHKRDKGNVGQKLDQLIYVKQVTFAQKQ